MSQDSSRILSMIPLQGERVGLEVKPLRAYLITVQLDQREEIMKGL